MSENKHTPEPWAVGEYWSSSRPYKIVFVLSVGSENILMDGTHRSFIRWVCKSDYVESVENQRDELLSALERIAAGPGSNRLSTAIEWAKDAIANVKGGAR